MLVTECLVRDFDSDDADILKLRKTIKNIISSIKTVFNVDDVKIDS